MFATLSGDHSFLQQRGQFPFHRNEGPLTSAFVELHRGQEVKEHRKEKKIQEC